MLGYYTLYIMVYNWFYVQKTVKIFVLISFYSLRLNFTKMRFGPVFADRSGLLGLAILGNRLPVFRPKNWTGPDLRTLWRPFCYQGVGTVG
jgi:hypothetical protein